MKKFEYYGKFEYCYNSDEILESIAYRRSDGTVMHRTIYPYHSGGTLKHTYYFTDGKTPERVYYFSSNGILAQLDFYDSEGILWHRETYQLAGPEGYLPYSLWIGRRHDIPWMKYGCVSKSLQCWKDTLDETCQYYVFPHADQYAEWLQNVIETWEGYLWKTP